MSVLTKSRVRVGLAVVGVLVLVGGLVGWWWSGRPQPKAAAPVNDVAGNFRVCLLTSSDSSRSAAVWAALQRAAATGKVNAQRFPAPAGQANAMPYVNGVVAVGCGLVVVADDGLIRVVEAAAAKAQQQRFLVVGAGKAAGNLEVVSGPEDVSAWLSRHVVGG